MLHSKKIRDQKGAAITGLVIALMFFMLLAGLFCFDASRVQMAQRELTATCDAAALAGTAMLTSYDVSNDDNPPFQKLANAQQNAAAYAYNMFLMGNVLGKFLQGNTQLVSTLSALTTTTDGEAKVVIGLVDPKNSFATVDPTPPNNENGRAIAVFAGYGYHPIFISVSFLGGVGNVGIRASSIGGLPQVDSVLVFDFSGSMDDLTPVTFVKRWWNSTPVAGYTGSDPDSSQWTVDHDILNGPGGGGAPDNNYPGWVVDSPDNGMHDVANIADANAYVAPQVPAYGGKHYPEKFIPGIPGPRPGNQDVDYAAAKNTTGVIQYDEVPNPQGGAGPNQQLITYVGLDTVNNIQGTSLNVLPPQNLYNSELGTVYTNHDIIVFKPYLRHHFNSDDFGSPPGNCPAFRPGVGPGNLVHVLNDPVAHGNPLTSHEDYTIGSINQPLGKSTNNIGASNSEAVNIYTDLVVNITNPANVTVQTQQGPVAGNSSYPPPQPLWGAGSMMPGAPAMFSGFDYTFPGTELDPTISGQTFSFQNLAVVVEASRGNLDSQTNRDNTGLHRGYYLNAAGVSGYFGAYSNMPFQAGYQKAYQRLAMLYSQPIASSVDGADQGFFQKLSALADCRFGLVGFSDSDPFPTAPNPNSVATPHTGIPFGPPGPTYSAKNSYYIDILYYTLVQSLPPASQPNVWDGRHVGAEIRFHENNDAQPPGGLPGFRIPRTPLDTGIQQAESLKIVTEGHDTTPVPWSNPAAGDGLYNGRPLSGTMCAEALETARQSFFSGSYDGASRAGSKHAIVFFTDGIPSGGVPSPEATAAGNVADQCQADGTAMFCIGLNMLDDPTMGTIQDTFLGNSATGLSGRAKNGGRFFECSDVSGVKQAFSAIARRLTQSQR